MKKTNNGKLFETKLIKSIPENYFLIRLQDAGGWGNATNLRFSVKNPCDFILYAEHKLFLLELKSQKKKSMSFNRISDNQMKSFIKYSKYRSIGVHCYFMLEFSDYGIVYLINFDNFYKFLQSTTKKSISMVECSKIGIKVITLGTKLDINSAIKEVLQ